MNIDSLRFLAARNTDSGPWHDVTDALGIFFYELLLLRKTLREGTRRVVAL